MRQRAGLALLLLSLAAVAPMRSMAAVSADDFTARTTGQLLALCSAAPDDPMATAAISFCHGFAVAVTRTLQEEDAANPRAKAMFCLPPSGIDRNHAVAEFNRWVAADPSRASMPATDGVAAFLAAQFPCR